MRWTSQVIAVVLFLAFIWYISSLISEHTYQQGETTLSQQDSESPTAEVEPAPDTSKQNPTTSGKYDMPPPPEAYDTPVQLQQPISADFKAGYSQGYTDGYKGNDRWIESWHSDDYEKGYEHGYSDGVRDRYYEQPQPSPPEEFYPPPTRWPMPWE